MIRNKRFESAPQRGAEPFSIRQRKIGMRYLSSLMVIVMLSGCTYVLWAPSDEYESIMGIYVNQERNELFVAGENHGYVFPIDDSFEEILILGRDIEFMPFFSSFVLSKDNVIEGDVRLRAFLKDLSKDQEAQLMGLGFELYTSVLEYKTKLKGERYLLEGDLPLKKYETGYHVTIILPDSKTDVAKKIVATPGAIVFDTVITAPIVFLLVLASMPDSF